MLELLPHLLRPLWLLALLPLPYALWRVQRSTRAHDPWRRVIDPNLLPFVLGAPDTGRPRFHASLLAATWLLAVFALAGPSWARVPTPLQRPGAALVVLLDLSYSMYAEDVAPNRLVRARQEAADLLQRFQGGGVALIAYAGDAHTVAPLTDDARTATNLLAALAPAMMPIPGSDLSAALRQARTLLDGGGETRGAVVVITDEVRSPDDVRAFGDRRFPISVLGIGTASGGTIPLDAGGDRGNLLSDDAGRPVVARLDAQALAELARRGGGIYVDARADDADTTALLQTVDTSATGDGKGSASSARALRWQDHGYLLVLLLLPLCAYAFRRGFIVAVACVVLTGVAVVPTPTYAATVVPADRAAPASAAPTETHNPTHRAWDDLWWRRDQQGQRALDSGRNDDAARLFDTPARRGTALYRAGRFDDAARSFAEAGGSDAAYNRGNALARAGNNSAAIAAYDEALRLDPKNADAAFNRALVRKLTPPKPSRPTPQSGNQQRSNGARSAAQPQSAQGDGKQTKNGQPQQNQAGSASTPPAREATTPQRPNDSAQAQRAQQQDPARGGKGNAQTPSRAATQADAKSDEARRATEQWLRRVPDEPGGLLRRKFQTESSLRALRGEQPAHTEQPW